MDINNNNLIFFLIISILINIIIINYANPIARSLGLIDKPNKGRKKHSKETPLIAGLSILIFLIIILVSNYFLKFILDNDFIIIFISSIAVFFVGIIDDKIDLSPLKKIFLITIITYFAILSSENLLITKFYLSTYDTFFYIKYFPIMFTILCLLTLTNALNLIDGINGLAIGVVIIWFLSFLVMFDYQFAFTKDSNAQIFFGIIILNLFFIFVWNVNGSYFLGDSGSLFLSYFFGMVIIKTTNENFTLDYAISSFISAEQILILFLIPFLDMLRVMLSRITNKKNPFSGDRNHFHHFILNFVSNKKYVIWVYFFYVISPIALSLIFKETKIELIIIFTTMFYLISLKYISKN